MSIYNIEYLLVMSDLNLFKLTYEGLSTPKKSARDITFTTRCLYCNGICYNAHKNVK